MRPLLFEDLGIDIATLTAIVGLLMLVYRSLKEVKADRQQAKADALQISQKLDKLEEIHAVALANRAGNRNLHRYLLQTELKIAIQQGYTTSSKLDEVSVLFESYVALGGNGATAALYDKFKQLPLKEDGFNANAK